MHAHSVLSIYQRRSSHIASDKITLSKMQVVNGKMKVEFLPWISMSPGKWPSLNGNLSAREMSAPAATKTKPAAIKSFPNPTILV
jgi:hypothetical protein